MDVVNFIGLSRNVLDVLLGLHDSEVLVGNGRARTAVTICA
jgi:hypothetical protein